MMSKLTRVAAGAMVLLGVFGASACGPRNGAVRDEESQAVLAQQAAISQQQATTTALGAVPGAVRLVRLSREAGTVVYYVVVQPQAGGAPTAVHVDAVTGSVRETGPAAAADGDDDD
jgi:uncharacterized membrane protein YkoI